MSLLPRHLAPAGAPIAPLDLAAWLRLAATADGPAALESALRARFGERDYVLTSTGRAGMTLLLRAMRPLAAAERDEVVMPTYTCYSVAASAVKAGLKVRLIDIDPATLDYQPDALAGADFRRVLAVIGTNLYGLPSDMPAITAAGHAHGAFVIDDAAQAMGASVGGRLSGTWGDAGLFSFDKGKNVSAIDGGVVTTTSATLAEALRAETSRLAAPGAVTAAIHVAKALAYAAMLNPTAYAAAMRLPGLGLGQTTFTTDYPLERFDPRLAALAATMLPKLDAFALARRTNAAALTAALGALPGLRVVTTPAAAVSAALRLPVLCADGDVKQRLVSALQRAGIGATGSYPASLADVAELQPHLAGPVVAAGGRDVARRLLTLPTHPFVTPADVMEVREVMAAVLAARPGTGAVSAQRLRENH